MKILHRGAEAVLYVNEQGNIVKDRIKKGYRIEQIDYKLRKFRTRREAKLLRRQIIPSPEVLSVDETETKITMQYIKGQLIKDILDTISDNQRKKICRQIGNNIAKLHDQNIIHGDLTTSNMILKDDSIYFVDFGLGFISEKAEDKAVDLHLLKKALEAKHYKNFRQCFGAVLQTYKKSRNAGQVLERLKQVESRGRYKKR
ncbi:MAG: Kae1-associated serine/threonine protein kinase [Nanoarchaeota archaeon]|nr:Kae1-associated serine/threonine protein kinase [Nanoarchaeota archaeon]